MESRKRAHKVWSLKNRRHSKEKTGADVFLACSGHAGHVSLAHKALSKKCVLKLL